MRTTVLAIILGLTVAFAVLVAVLVELYVSAGTTVRGDAPTVDGGWRNSV